MAAAPTARWPKPLRPLIARPHLLAAALLGLVFYLVAGAWVPNGVARALVAWDLGIGLFSASWLISMRDCEYERMRARALAHDEGRHVMLVLALVAATASIVAILAELGGAKNGGPMHEAAGVGLTIGTIIVSWFFVHLVFAIHYAHAYYMAEAASGPHRGGLLFPEDEAPDYWDFLHFAVIIGATSQTADISIASKDMRRIATAHCMIAFAFNTAILATMINLAAGLF